jgi:hypothetical protein
LDRRLAMYKLTLILMFALATMVVIDGGSQAPAETVSSEQGATAQNQGPKSEAA